MPKIKHFFGRGCLKVSLFHRLLEPPGRVYQPQIAMSTQPVWKNNAHLGHGPRWRRWRKISPVYFRHLRVVISIKSSRHEYSQGQAMIGLGFAINIHQPWPCRRSASYEEQPCHWGGAGYLTERGRTNSTLLANSNTSAGTDVVPRWLFSIRPEQTSLVRIVCSVELAEPADTDEFSQFVKVPCCGFSVWLSSDAISGIEAPSKRVVGAEVLQSREDALSLFPHACHPRCHLPYPILLSLARPAVHHVPCSRTTYRAGTSEEEDEADQFILPHYARPSSEREREAGKMSSPPPLLFPNPSFPYFTSLHHRVTPCFQ